MKNQLIIYLTIIVFTISCKNSTHDENLNVVAKSVLDTMYVKSHDLKYLMNPDSVDVLCKNDVERAKIDLKKYLGVYVQTICFGCDSKPYEEEIKEILKRKHFKFGIQEFGCMAIIGQTSGCYKGYIDLKMKEKYGDDYEIKIENEAEKLFIENIDNNNRIIEVFYLETKDDPKLLSEDSIIDNGESISLRTQIPITQNASARIFFDLKFIVEKNGTLSNFSVSNWVNNEHKENEKVKQKLFDFAIEEFKTKYNKWKPGIYKNHLVRTEQTLRVYFD